MATTVPEPPQGPQAAPPSQKRHPWHWIVPCVLLFLIAIGLAIWAFSLQGDLDDERAHSAQVEQQAQATQDDVQAVSDQVDELSQSANTAADELSQSTDQAAQDAEAALNDVQSSIDSLSNRAKTAKDKLSKALEDAQAGQN
jgi:uncharacterized protein YoxC